MKKTLFKQKDIEAVCPQKMVWDEMEVVGAGKRHCKGCDKVLVDVTGYTKEQVDELQKKDPSICVAVTNALLVSSLSFSLLSAGGDSVEENRTTPIEINNIVLGKVKVPIIPEVEEIVAVGMPALPPQPICTEGTANLNAIKRFFGFEEDKSCVEEEDE